MRNKRNKIKIFGIGAAVLMILIALSPTFIAVTEENSMFNEGVEGNNGENEEEEDPPECEWRVDITETHDEKIEFIDPIWAPPPHPVLLRNGHIILTSDGGIVEGDAYAHNFILPATYLSGSVSSTKHIHIYRECPDGVADDCCCEVKVIMQPRFKVRAEVFGNAEAMAGGYFQIVTPECSVSKAGGVAVGDVDPVGISPKIAKNPSVTFQFTVAPGNSDEKVVSAVEICTIESCDVDIIALGAGYLNVNANGWFRPAIARAEILEWDLGIEIQTKCDCESGGVWTPLVLPE